MFNVHRVAGSERYLTFSVALCSGFYLPESLHRQHRLFIVNCTVLISLVRQTIATVSHYGNTGSEVTYEN